MNREPYKNRQLEPPSKGVLPMETLLTPFSASCLLPVSNAGLPTKRFSWSPYSAARFCRNSDSLRCFAQVATGTDPALGVEKWKYDLLRVAQDTQRGLVATAEQRASIEEALVSVESCDAGSAIDIAKLDGTWRLNYTSAPDVLVLFEAAARLPFLQVGQIFQKFECRDQSDGGIVRNVVLWSIPTLLEEQEGATLNVSAKFSVVSKRHIYLQFEKIAIENLKISEQLQALIAPAILPRSFLSLQILQFLQTFRAQVPVRSPERRSVGGLYYLSYLDRDMLLGRAVGGGGVFVFTRAQALW
ncbi:probable plastid-lipid-associated protein 10, chloroplastic [Aristolochia californica]|uniref:probable plastid-lipid-associated protein 10, chloroplastic n=1 Tax=Aristolochia californica TaxID=171875 RepID=UPI0035E245DF